jgi:ABC-type nitrate/sulfonate/bicarbonate transport system permease component
MEFGSDLGYVVGLFVAFVFGYLMGSNPSLRS